MVICRVVKERWWKMRWVAVRLRWVGRRTHRHIYTHIHMHAHTHIHTHIHTNTHTHILTHTHTHIHIHTHTPCTMSKQWKSSYGIDNQTCHNHQFEQSASQNGLRWTLDSAINVCVCECVYVHVSFFLFLLCYHQPVSHAFLLHNTSSLSFDLYPHVHLQYYVAKHLPYAFTTSFVCVCVYVCVHLFSTCLQVEKRCTHTHTQQRCFRRTLPMLVRCVICISSTTHKLWPQTLHVHQALYSSILFYLKSTDHPPHPSSHILPLLSSHPPLHPPSPTPFHPPSLSPPSHTPITSYKPPLHILPLILPTCQVLSFSTFLHYLLLPHILSPLCYFPQNKINWPSIVEWKYGEFLFRHHNY